VRIYLVGGAVRDELLGREVRDRDYVVLNATQQQFLESYPGARKVGGKKGVFIYRGEEYTLAGEQGIEADLRRRDLTINGLAKGEDGVIHALPGALRDLRDKVLRPVSADNFFRDPLRALRAARFCACLPDFSVSRELTSLMQSVARSGLLRTPAAERVGAEVRKACSCPRPGRFLSQLARSGLLHPWLRELAPAGRAGFPGPGADEENLRHAARIMDLCAGDPRRVWMGLCHDLYSTDPDRNEAREAPARRLGLRLRLPGRLVRAGAAAARWHETAARYPKLPSPARLDLLLGLHRERALEEVFVLVWIHTGRDHIRAANADLRAVLDVRLPDEHRDLGRKSGEKLRQLRLEVLERRRARVEADAAPA
jgi:tRNA nucleotidyltransferase (CCA-adding enzyme)